MSSSPGRRGTAIGLSGGRALTSGLVLVAMLTLLGCPSSETAEDSPATSQSARLELTTLLSGNAEGFERAVDPRQFVFPRDHGSHPDFRTEWWYLTGNLATETGRRFGYQFTIFRNAMTAESPARQSAWATHQIYMGHLALTDVEGQEFHTAERFARGAAGLAGAQLEPFRVWLEDWRLTGEDSGPPFRLKARNGEIEIELDLAPTKPLVLQGDAGLSRKGLQPGNASYYYAFTRMATAGRIRVDGADFEVQGSSWLDREWSTSALEPGQRGWDWFALQLDDGSDLMVYQMRRDDGSPDPASSGSLVDLSGSKEALSQRDFQLEVVDWWTSPHSGARYPAKWRLALPEEELRLRIEPLVSDQELRLSVLYWEGAVRIEGSRAGRPIAGTGYVELTGYGAP